MWHILQMDNITTGVHFYNWHRCLGLFNNLASINQIFIYDWNSWYICYCFKEMGKPNLCETFAD